MAQSFLKSIAEDDVETAKKLINLGKSLKAKDSRGNTALHIAVARNNVDIINYLLSQKQIVINAINLNKETPFFLAVEKGYIEIVRLLLNSGANIHLPKSKNVTPLHISVLHPPITQLLIASGAQIEARDVNGETPLHYAASYNNLETVCMLLYYNADANAINNDSKTPFTRAMFSMDQDVQIVLLDYSDLSSCDSAFLSYSILFKIHHTFFKKMIENGAKVTLQSFNTSLQLGHCEYFRIILEHIAVEEIKNVTFNDFLDLVSNEDTEEYFEIFMESPKIEVLVKNMNYMFIMQNLLERLSESVFTKFVMLVLMLGHSLTSIDIACIFYRYGYSELLRYLLYIDYRSQFHCMCLPTKLIFDVTSTVDIITQDVLSFDRSGVHSDALKKYLEYFFEYCCVPTLIHYYKTLNFESQNNQLISCMPKIPSLVELARNKTREHIIHTKKYYKASQYYTYVNRLEVSLIYRKILMFETKLYGNNK